MRTPARRSLNEWMGEDPARTQTWVAKQLGVTQPAVAGWVSGRTRPEIPTRQLLELLTGGRVREHDWLTASERAKRDALVQRATGTEGV